jgi:outer membrane protein W
MKKMKPITLFISILLAVVLGVQPAKAQYRTYEPASDDLPTYTPSPVTFQVRYGIGFPLDGLQQQVSQASYNGWDASLMFHIGYHFSLGLAVEYQDFYQKYPRAVYHYGNDYTNISAVVSNSIQNLPFLLKSTYSFLKPSACIQPYIGVGVGINNLSYRQYLGEFSNFNQTSDQLALNGEAGFNIPLTRNHRLGLNLAAEYHYLPFNQDGIPNLDMWDVRGGFYVPL